MKIMKVLSLITIYFVMSSMIYATDNESENYTDAEMISVKENQLENYVRSFDYAARKEMKIDSKGLIELLEQGEAQLIDIRFPEEYEAWKVGPSISIPLNELPDNLSIIDESKVVVVACPHKDRAIIAMTYLRSKGIKAKYITDGLIGLAENLRGDNAKSFLEALDKLNP